MSAITKLEELNTYSESIKLASEVFALCKNKDLIKEYSLCDQIKRASTSVSANIAEGFGRNTKKDFSQFLSISLGSANEMIAFLDVINLSFKIIKTKELRERYVILCKQIYSFRKHILS